MQNHLIRFLSLLLLMFCCTESFAKPKKTKKDANDVVEVSRKISTTYGVPILATHAILIDYTTGTQLLECEATGDMTPSSMTKILTAYLVLKKLAEGKITEDTEFTVSHNAFRIEGSTSFLNINDRVKVIDLLKGLIIQSGNDAAVVLAEGISGSEQAFAIELNQLAKELGLKKTHFLNASGLPQEGHKTTALDLSILAKRIIKDFPDYYHLWSMKEYSYANARQMNRNPLLYKDMGCDGIKTGSSEAAGFGMVATCIRGDRRLILVVNGLKNMNERARESQNLLEWGFSTYENYKILNKDHKIATIPVWYGHINHVDVVVPQDIVLTLKRIDPALIKHKISYDSAIYGAHSDGEIVGKVIVEAPGLKSPLEFPLVIAEDIKASGIFKTVYDWIVKTCGGRKS